VKRCLVASELILNVAALEYTNVRDYAEGKQYWIDEGLPVESDHKH